MHLLAHLYHTNCMGEKSQIKCHLHGLSAKLGFYLQIEPLSADKWYICRNAENQHVCLLIQILSASVAISADIICK